MRGKIPALEERETTQEKAWSQELIQYFQGEDQLGQKVSAGELWGKGQTDKVDDDKPSVSGHLGGSVG